MERELSMLQIRRQKGTFILSEHHDFTIEMRLRNFFSAEDATHEIPTARMPNDTSLGHPDQSTQLFLNENFRTGLPRDPDDCLLRRCGYVLGGRRINGAAPAP